MATNLKALSFVELERWVAERGWPRYRADQILNWTYARGAISFDEMTDLPQEIRHILGSEARLGRLEVASRQDAADGTIKFLFALEDGVRIETVLIPDGIRRTVCISTQAGCTLDCVFCYTGRMGLGRNLKAWEIVGQVETVRDEIGRRVANGITNIVMMGMGEPLANFDQVAEAIVRITDPRGLGLSPRRVTVSTAGLVPQIARLGKLPQRVNLAVSLNAADDATRRRLMPAADRLYPLDELIAACRAYPLPPHRRLTFEYVLLRGVNDRPEDARRLGKLLSGMRCKLNLIPFNAFPDSGFEAPPEEDLLRFQEIVRASGLNAFIRKSKGRDILAACGQLNTLPVEAASTAPLR